MQLAQSRGRHSGLEAVFGVMVLVENLGNGLGDDYIVIDIKKDVRFADEIIARVTARRHVILKAWGKAISLAVRLALSTVEEGLPGCKIGRVTIGTERDVEIPVKQKPRREATPGEFSDPDEAENVLPGVQRVTKALSWMEIAIEKA